MGKENQPPHSDDSERDSIIFNNEWPHSDIDVPTEKRYHMPADHREFFTEREEMDLEHRLAYIDFVHLLHKRRMEKDPDGNAQK